MPVPAELTGEAYALIQTAPQAITTKHAVGDPRRTVTKQFHSYLELYFQAKHDGGIRRYCAARRIECRAQDGTQVDPANNGPNPIAYYANAATVAGEVVAAIMHQRWTANNTNNTVFITGAKNILAVQGVRQRNGLHYDLSFWYEPHDIYLSFHCYPPRR